MSYKVLAPCIVRDKGGQSATHYREVGQVIDVSHQEDADILVAGRFLEKVEDAAPAEKPAEKPKPGQ